MAYETGTASSPADLIAKLRTFALANGWSSTNTLDGFYVLSKGTVYAPVAWTADHIYVTGCLSASAGANWNAQPNASPWTCYSNVTAGPYTAYHFYALTEDSKDLLAAVVEISSGIFRHLVIADLIKRGAWTGGTYVNCTYWQNNSNLGANSPYSSYHRRICDNIQPNAPAGGSAWCDLDGLSNNWVLEWYHGDFTASTRCQGNATGSGMNAWHVDLGWQRWNIRTPLFPLELVVNRPSSLRSPMGRIPAMRWANLRNHTVGEIINIGGSDFQLWPMCQRTDTWDTGSAIPSSGYIGYAYKRT